MACRSAVALSSVSRPSSALRAAAPRASRTGRRSVNVQSAVELDYDVKVFDKELVSPATHRTHPWICHASNEHPQSSRRSRQHTCMRLSLSPCPQHIFALLLRFAASSWAADPAAGRCESPAAARAASRNVCPDAAVKYPSCLTSAGVFRGEGGVHHPVNIRAASTVAAVEGCCLRCGVFANPSSTSHAHMLSRTALCSRRALCSVQRWP
jgi:hypothetical protein